MDEMKLLEEFCAAEPDPRPAWVTRARSDLTGRIGATRRHRRVRGWLTPLAAAVAVVAAIAVPLAVLHGPAPKPRPKPSIANPRGPGGTPPYFAANPASGRYVVIGSTATGKTLATVHPPAGTITYALGASADDRTFLLQTWTHASGDWKSTIYLARFNPRRRTVSVTKMPVHLGLASTPFVDHAMSPDGTMLAVTRFDVAADKLTVTIFNLATGHSRTWTGPDPDLLANETTGWWANSRQFEIGWLNPAVHGNQPVEYTYRLNIATPGGRLPAPHKQAIPNLGSGSIQEQYAAPDGDLIFSLATAHNQWTLEEHTPGTHRYTRLLGPVRAAGVVGYIAWASDNGQVVIAVGMASGLGYVSHGHFTPLPQTAVTLKGSASIVW